MILRCGNTGYTISHYRSLTKTKTSSETTLTAYADLSKKRLPGNHFPGSLFFIFWHTECLAAST